MKNVVILTSDGSRTPGGVGGGACTLELGSSRLKLLFFLGEVTLLEAELFPALFGLVTIAKLTPRVTWRSDNLPLLHRAQKGAEAAPEDQLWLNFSKLLTQAEISFEHQRRESHVNIRACDRASRWASERGEALLKKFGEGPIGRLSRETPEEAWKYFDARPWVAALRSADVKFDTEIFERLTESALRLF